MYAPVHDKEEATEEVLAYLNEKAEFHFTLPCVNANTLASPPAFYGTFI